MSILLLIGIFDLTVAQNSYPSDADIILDGYGIKLHVPDQTGWARGLIFSSHDGTTRYGNIGIYGGGQDVKSLYMAHGDESPWNSGLGIYVKPDGKVGVGTIEPTSRLAVNGTTQTKEIIVTEQSSLWPDYVFDAGYRLPDLKELEAFIQAKRHLPGIPVEEEIRNKGQNLGAIQAKLLQKIEELTLYVIELEKQDREQLQRIEELESKHE
ncbi:MAG: hypothetical protein WD604_05410 [Balneolaceae bacterium]